ncbi:heavy-metal-associated domain-containing protein [Amycolatopsis sp.]|jgi:copper chaperone CopZ|uniref:heavy-metal-associated domain-containing protein n=1 Tax=Amycolatopsis sp. TaxID=37632 RepID=UPI002E0BA5DA|nr:heavy-metal-associated domain-containing protein [Amycolatopsis sp.]
MIKASYTVTGMSCGHCAQSVTDELMELNGVSEVAVDLEAKLVTVTSENRLPDAAVHAAVTEAGYSVAEPATA